MTGLAVTPISTTEAVVVSLREKILDGAIEPGAPLPEADLDARVRRRPPDRARGDPDALPRGPAQRERNRSASSPCSRRDDVRDLFSVRIPIECLIVREVLERDAPLGERPRGDRPPRGAARDSHWSEVVDADLGFHHALARAVGSPRLERLYASMSGEIRLCIAQLRPTWASPPAMADEHRECSR